MRRHAEPRYLALDQGGHSSRALAFSITGELIASAQVSVTTTYPHPGWVEQDALALSASLRTASAQLRDKLGQSWQHLRAAGLATQRSNCLCWDKRNGQPLSPALSWQDRRAQAWLETQAIDQAWLRARTGLYASPHYGASKLRWCLDHLSDVRAAAQAGHLVCGPLAAFLVRQLTASNADCIDPANAARTLLWNLASREWDAELLERFGIAPELLPETVSSRHAYGDIEGVPMCLLTGDQSAALYAGGAPRHDTLYINLGTGAFLQRLLPLYSPPPDGVLGSIVYADATHADYALEATVNGAGTAFDWARDQLGIQDIESRLPHWLQQTGEVPVFLNGIAGLGSPWWRPNFISRFVGVGEPWAQAVAVAESVLFLILTNLERLNVDEPVRRIQLSGGLARLDGLVQRLADITGLTILRSNQIEATARGVAWLLADADRQYWTEDSFDSFTPESNPDCINRLECWRDEMQKALHIN